MSGSDAGLWWWVISLPTKDLRMSTPWGTAVQRPRIVTFQPFHLFIFIRIDSGFLSHGMDSQDPVILIIMVGQGLRRIAVFTTLTVHQARLLTSCYVYLRREIVIIP